MYGNTDNNSVLLKYNTRKCLLCCICMQKKSIANFESKNKTKILKSELNKNQVVFSNFTLQLKMVFIYL